MPNHLHGLLYFPQMPKSLNTIIANAKRFIAYEMIKRLEGAKEEKLLALLRNGVKDREKKKGQVHKVFEDSFDAKQCYNKDFLFEKLNYIHHNPVSKKWSLGSDFVEYEYSSASFYESGIMRYENKVHVNDALSGNLPGSLPRTELSKKTPGEE